MTWTTFVAE